MSSASGLATTTPLPELHFTSTESGVPVIWSPYPALLRANLLFRVGQADESLATRGITHLCEHLALGTLGQPTYQFNGEVSDVTTGFDVSGEPAEVVGHLDRLCRALRALPTERVEDEKRILQIEQSGSDSPLDVYAGIGSDFAGLDCRRARSWVCVESPRKPCRGGQVRYSTRVMQFSGFPVRHRPIFGCR